VQERISAGARIEHFSQEITGLSSSQLLLAHYPTGWSRFLRSFHLAVKPPTETLPRGHVPIGDNIHAIRGLGV
jgi:hypothetical protein